jgi:thiol:disulfide interchange protein DsbC
MEKYLHHSTRFFIFTVVCLGLLIGTGNLYPISGWAQCPPTEKLQQGIKKIFPKLQYELIKIGPSEMSGFCQVQLKIGAQVYLLYFDSRGDFLLSGNIFDLKSGKNLTLETQLVANRLSPEEMRQLESLSPFHLGNGKKVVYLATDPQCPYCKQAEALLRKIMAKEDLQVRFLLLPLDIHKGAREQCISILCDNKGLEGFDSGYQSANQCGEGIKKIDNTTAFLQKKGISSTPTFIFGNGIYISGLLSEEDLQSRLGLQ